MAALGQGVILLAASGFAIVDAVRRLGGHHSILGQGAGLGRLLALVQLIVALAILFGLFGL